MSILFTKFNYTPTLEIGETNPNTEEILDVVRTTISIGEEGKNNSMTLILKNPPINLFSDYTVRNTWVDSDGVIRLKAVKSTQGTVISEEVVDTYALYNDSDPTIDVDSSDYLIFSGVINKGSIKYDISSGTIEITCLDRNQVIMNKIAIPTFFEISDAKNSPEIMQQIVRVATDGVPDDALGFDNSGNTSKGYPYFIDARLFSEGISSTGTATSVSTRKLINSGATFQTDGVEKGDWVRNTDDNETAYILSVDSETQVTLSKDIFTSAVGYEISDGFIQTFRPDGTVFPDIAYSRYNKPVTDILKELCQIENCNTEAEKNIDTGTLVNKRGMRWFIDKRNRLHVYYPTDTPDYYVNIGLIESISPDTSVHYVYQGVDLDNEVRGTVNFIIYYAGNDMLNNPIKYFSRARFTGTPITKDSFRDWESIAYGMKIQDETSGNITRGTATVDEFKFPSSYPVTPSWDSQGRSVSSNLDYNTNFIEEAKNKANNKAQSEFQKLANPKWGGQLPIRGEDIRPGDLINCTSKPHGIIGINLRVKSVSHIISPEQGWQTTLTVEEDELEQQTR